MTSVHTSWLAKRQQPTHTGQADIPRIGTFWHGQGGVYAGVVRAVAGLPDYHLIVAASESGHHPGVAWGEPGKGMDEPDTVCECDGLANTLALGDSAHVHPAAEWAAALVIDSHADFYLPSRHELRLACLHVPELFLGEWYWSSTQWSDVCAWAQYFDGIQDYLTKSVQIRARAVRRLVVSSFDSTADIETDGAAEQVRGSPHDRYDEPREAAGQQVPA